MSDDLRGAMRRSSADSFRSEYSRALVDLFETPAVAASDIGDASQVYDVSVDDLIVRGVDETLRLEVEERCRKWQQMDERYLAAPAEKGGLATRWATKTHLAIPQGLSMTQTSPPDVLTHPRVPDAVKDEYFSELQSLVLRAPRARVLLKNTQAAELHLMALRNIKDSVGLNGKSQSSALSSAYAPELSAIRSIPSALSAVPLTGDITGTSDSSSAVAKGEVVISFSLHSALQRQQDVDLLGCQTLRDLRDALRCGRKGRGKKFASTASDENSTRDDGFFFIEGAFYTIDGFIESVSGSIPPVGRGEILSRWDATRIRDIRRWLLHADNEDARTEDMSAAVRRDMITDDSDETARDEGDEGTGTEEGAGESSQAFHLREAREVAAFSRTQYSEEQWEQVRQLAVIKRRDMESEGRRKEAVGAPPTSHTTSRRKRKGQDSAISVACGIDAPSATSSADDVTSLPTARAPVTGYVSCLLRATEIVSKKARVSRMPSASARATRLRTARSKQSVSWVNDVSDDDDSDDDDVGGAAIASSSTVADSKDASQELSASARVSSSSDCTTGSRTSRSSNPVAGSSSSSSNRSINSSSSSSRSRSSSSNNRPLVDRLALNGLSPSPALSVLSLDTSLSSLILRPGVRYLFRHRSNTGCDCEHFLYVTDMHLHYCSSDSPVGISTRCNSVPVSTTRDLPLLSNYPRQTFLARAVAKKCGVCLLWSARYVVYGDRLADRSPMLYCQHCYFMLHYAPSGETIYDDFSVHPYDNDDNEDLEAA